MASIKNIRNELASALDDFFGDDVQVSAYVLASPTPPAAQIVPDEVEYDATMARGYDNLVFKAQLFVGYTADRGAQEKLDQYLAGSGTTSVKEAIEKDRTLGGACDTLRVTRCSGYQALVRDQGGPVLMAEWTIEIQARGA